MDYALQCSGSHKAMSEFLLPVVAYLITFLVLWATVAISKAVASRVPSLPATSRAPLMVGSRTQ